MVVCSLGKGWVGKYIYMGGSDNEFGFDMSIRVFLIVPVDTNLKVPEQDCK